MISLTFQELDNTWFVSADHKRVKQVLINLLSNAIKYHMKQGMVELTCVKSGTGRIRVNIRGPGVGMNAAELSQLFQAFRPGGWQ